MVPFKGLLRFRMAIAVVTHELCDLTVAIPSLGRIDLDSGDGSHVGDRVFVFWA